MAKGGRKSEEEEEQLKWDELMKEDND